MVNKKLKEAILFKTFSKFDRTFLEFRNVLAWKPIYNTNVTLAILYRDFTSNAFTKT